MNVSYLTVMNGFQEKNHNHLSHKAHQCEMASCDHDTDFVSYMH